MWESPPGLLPTYPFAFANRYSGPSPYKHLGIMTTFLFLERNSVIFTLQPHSSDHSVITTTDRARAFQIPQSLFSVLFYFVNTTSGMSMINCKPYDRSVLLSLQLFHSFDVPIISRQNGPISFHEPDLFD